MEKPPFQFSLAALLLTVAVLATVVLVAVGLDTPPILTGLAMATALAFFPIVVHIALKSTVIQTIRFAGWIRKRRAIDSHSTPPDA